MGAEELEEKRRLKPIRNDRQQKVREYSSVPAFTAEGFRVVQTHNLGILLPRPIFAVRLRSYPDCFRCDERRKERQYMDPNGEQPYEQM